MSIENLKNLIPDYAKDIKLNLTTLARDETLTGQQLWGTFLSTALASRNAKVIAEIEEEAKEQLSEDALQAAKAAASIMAMNNIYYKFTGFMSEGDYRNMPAKLRMNVIGKPGVDLVDFELWSLAVSAVNGCKYCILSHEKKLRDEGISAEQVQTAVRVASVVHAVAATIEGEDVLQGEIAQAA